MHQKLDDKFSSADVPAPARLKPDLELRSERSDLLARVLRLIRATHPIIPVVERDTSYTPCRQCGAELEKTLDDMIARAPSDLQALSITFGYRFEICTCEWDADVFRWHPRWVRGEA